MAEPQLPVNNTKIAYRGQQFNLDNYPRVQLPKSSSLEEKYNFSEQGLDYKPSIDLDPEDLKQLNKELIDLRIRLHEIRNQYRKARRVASFLKWQFDQEKKRALIQITGMDAKQREAVAEIMCQNSYSEWIVANTVADELNDMSRSLRIELDALREMCYNARRQIDLDVR
jgi:hypothetical protein